MKNICLKDNRIHISRELPLEDEEIEVPDYGFGKVKSLFYTERDNFIQIIFGDLEITFPFSFKF